LVKVSVFLGISKKCGLILNPKNKDTHIKVGGFTKDLPTILFGNVSGCIVFCMDDGNETLGNFVFGTKVL